MILRMLLNLNCDSDCVNQPTTEPASFRWPRSWLEVFLRHQSIAQLHSSLIARVVIGSLSTCMNDDVDLSDLHAVRCFRQPGQVYLVVRCFDDFARPFVDTPWESHASERRSSAIFTSYLLGAVMNVPLPIVVTDEVLILAVSFPLISNLSLEP